MIANPSPEWTERERLAVIAEHTKNMLRDKTRLFNAHRTYTIIETIHLVSVMHSAFLEANREQMMTLE